MSSPGTLQPLSAAQGRELESAFRLLQSGQAEDALAIAKRLVGQATRSPDAHQLLAISNAETGNIEAADIAFGQALALAPDHPLILVNHAALLRKTRRFDAALAVLQRVIDATPGFAKAWSEFGLTAAAAGRHQQALMALGRAVQLQPESVPAWLALGNASRESGDLEIAQSAFRRAIALDPAHPSASINLGNVLRLAGRPDEAITCLEAVVRRGHGNPEVSDALVGVLLDDGRPDEAMELARQVAKGHPDFVPGLMTLANLLWEHGPALAPEDSPFDLFRAAVERQPQHHALRTQFIQFLISAGSMDEALTQLRIARTQADRPELVWMQADILQSQGNTRQAGVHYAQLHRDWGAGVPVFLNAYARHLLRAGQWDDAAQKAAEATRMEPGNQEAWAYLGTAWRLMGDPREHWLCDYDRLIAMVDIEPPAEFADQSDFLGQLRATVDGMHKARREPMQQSLRGGSQTPGRLFGRRDRVLVAAQATLLRGVERWLAKLPKDDLHPFLMRKTHTVRMGGSWSVKLWSSGNHVNHIHPEGWISSAFYVSLPPSVGLPLAGQAGYIQFGQPPLELELGLPPRRVIRPEVGKLALFPSYLWHGTVPFVDEQARITVAFDMTPLEQTQ